MAGEEPLYTEWLARQPCARCKGRPSVPHHHTTRRGLGQRAHDRAAMPLCDGCHRWIHYSPHGPDKAFKREWQDLQVDIYRGLWAQQPFDGGVDDEPSF